MTEPIILPPGVAIGILAFLLSLLPAGLFTWLWYLRRHDRPVPGGAVLSAFIIGLLLVIPAFWLERQAGSIWLSFSPSTAHFYEGAVLPLQSLADILLPALGTFLIVALVEEGLRFTVLKTWFRRSRQVDQVFDGLMIGLAMGLGFATLENTLYFFQLFVSGEFNTLVLVFFLRFMVSTLAHVSFGGLMGGLVARGVFSLYRSRLMYLQAFFIPWFLHGLYDWLLGVNLTLYAVLMLLAPLVVLVIWSTRRDFMVVGREGRDVLLQQKPADLPSAPHASREPWNKNAPWLFEKKEPN